MDTRDHKPRNGDPLLRITGISKRFGCVQANDDISLSVSRGEILAILGENGAGKSTFISVLAGIYKPDEGEICWEGKPVDIQNPLDAVRLGIGVVHQHFSLIPELTVVENIILGLKTGRHPFTDLRAASQRVKEISERYGLVVDPETPVWQLSLGVRQRVEILKVLYRGADLLILDEPTAVLTPQETQNLIELLKRMAAEGCAVVFVSHKLYEVRALCQRAVVLRGGRLVADTSIVGMHDSDLARLMIGEAPTSVQIEPAAAQSGPELLRAESLACRSDRGLMAVKDVSFQMTGGEIVGIAGVAGNGQSELIECLTGMRPSVHGKLYLDGKEITRASCRKRREAGMAHVPEDRKGTGSVLDMGLDENLILGQHRLTPFARKGLLQMQTIRSMAATLLEKYNVRAAGIAARARTLSGGNLQKVVLARELFRTPRLVVAVEPTRGLDCGAVEFTHEQFVALREQGRSVLLVSTDLDEILQLCDRVYIMYHGALLGPVSPTVGKKNIGITMLTGEMPYMAEVQ